MLSPYIEWAIAYGSAVFPQSRAAENPLRGSASAGKTKTLLQGDGDCKGKTTKYAGQLRDFLALINDGAPCRDYLLLVPRKDLLVFHKENLAQNPTHYAWPFRIAGPSYVCKFQQVGRGVEVFYNTLLCLDHGQYGKQLSKYGVATVEDFQAELGDWSSLFFSGRLHKPVQFYSPKRTPIEYASFWPRLEANRLNAIRAALFLHLGAAFPVKTLLTTICGLSYTGDIRIGIAENPRKLENIVVAQTVELLALYYRLLTKHLPQVRILGSNIPSTSIERLCEQLSASCFGETNINRTWQGNAEDGACLRRLESPRSESTGNDYDVHTYEILREEIISGKLILEVPKADEGKRFRDRLLDALPFCVREDVWKRAHRRGRLRQCPNTLDKRGGELFSERKADQVNNLIARRGFTRSPTHGSSTDGAAPLNDNYPSPADLLASLTSIVQRSSAITALKSALTAGPSRMLAYGLRKLAKRWLSR